jgi:hypothetical protein
MVITTVPFHSTEVNSAGPTGVCARGDLASRRSVAFGGPSTSGIDGTIMLGVNAISAEPEVTRCSSAFTRDHEDLAVTA